MLLLSWAVAVDRHVKGLYEAYEYQACTALVSITWLMVPDLGFTQTLHELVGQMTAQWLATHLSAPHCRAFPTHGHGLLLFFTQSQTEKSSTRGAAGDEG